MNHGCAVVPTAEPTRRQDLTGQRPAWRAGLVLAAMAGLLISMLVTSPAEARSSCPPGSYHERTIRNTWEYVRFDVATYSITGRWCSVGGRIRWKRPTVTSQYGNHGQIRLVSKGSSISRTSRSAIFRAKWHIRFDAPWYLPDVDQDVCLRLGVWASGNRWASQPCS